MKLSADEQVVLRKAVRDHLERRPALGPLAPERRANLAGDMIAFDPAPTAPGPSPPAREPPRPAPRRVLPRKRG